MARWYVLQGPHETRHVAECVHTTMIKDGLYPDGLRVARLADRTEPSLRERLDTHRERMRAHEETTARRFNELESFARAINDGLSARVAALESAEQDAVGRAGASLREIGDRVITMCDKRIADVAKQVDALDAALDEAIAEHDALVVRIGDLEREPAPVRPEPGSVPADPDRLAKVAYVASLRAQGMPETLTWSPGERIVCRAIARAVEAACVPAAPRLRPEVLAFALAMESKLLANEHKGTWKGERAGAMLRRLGEEVAELTTVCERWATPGASMPLPEEILGEAADVGNFAMMIADVCGALSVAKVTTEPPETTAEPTDEELADRFNEAHAIGANGLRAIYSFGRGLARRERDVLLARAEKAEDFLARIANGVRAVSTAELLPGDITLARAEGRVFVCPDGTGCVLMPVPEEPTDAARDPFADPQRGDCFVDYDGSVRAVLAVGSAKIVYEVDGERVTADLDTWRAARAADGRPMTTAEVAAFKSNGTRPTAAPSEAEMAAELDAAGWMEAVTGWADTNGDARDLSLSAAHAAMRAAKGAR